MILFHNPGICAVIIPLGLTTMPMTLFLNTDTLNTLVNADYFNTIGSARLYGSDSRVGVMALTFAEPFVLLCYLIICARACVEYAASRT